MQRWHHSPPHLFLPRGTYFVTARTIEKELHYRGDQRLNYLQDTLFEVMEAYGWELDVWSVFSNHYHFIARAPEDATSLKPMLQRLHSQTSRWANELDGAEGRQVWFQYCDECLTYENSYFARFHYVLKNPVHHRVVGNAELYPWCSAAWFRANADPTFYRKVLSYRYDKLKIDDDFDEV